MDEDFSLAEVGRVTDCASSSVMNPFGNGSAV
jgi:hypothetical protein